MDNKSTTRIKKQTNKGLSADTTGNPKYLTPLIFINHDKSWRWHVKVTSAFENCIPGT